MKFKRIFVVVADSLGVGALPDAEKYGDLGANTLKHISEHVESFFIPNLERLGIGLLTEVMNVEKVKHPQGVVTKMAEISVGKDTLTGHFELMGLEVTKPFPSFTDTGFPDELLNLLTEKTGRKIIGNVSASGTEIIKDLGEEHMATGAMIVYTSADSVLQIAAHEEVIPIPELYQICEIARQITLENPAWQVGRIIARPFIGESKDTFKRTSNRHDYAVKPHDKTVLDHLKSENYDVIAIGKINDIFDGEGITEYHKTPSNQAGMEKTIELLQKDFTGLCFTNLVDFDAIYGHRRDPIGYGKCIEEFDLHLGVMMDSLKKDDLLIVVADHGNDPVHSGTDHTREYVPMIAYSKEIIGKEIPVRTTFADVAATIADNFSVKDPTIGTSFLNELNRKG
ncbi:MAG TPA: phosphopentomutase [Bacilli bacterium]|nr:phosphopentomutase [Bacilli bacterium]